MQLSPGSGTATAAKAARRPRREQCPERSDALRKRRRPWRAHPAAVASSAARRRSPPAEPKFRKPNFIAQRPVTPHKSDRGETMPDTPASPSQGLLRKRFAILAMGQRRFWHTAHHIKPSAPPRRMSLTHPSGKPAQERSAGSPRRCRLHPTRPRQYGSPTALTVGRFGVPDK